VRALHALRAASGRNVLVLEDLPTAEELDARRLLAVVGSLLGPVIAYRGEGDYIIEIREDPRMAAKRPSFANSREFFPHTDLSYVPDPPPFFALQSIVNNPDEGGLSVFCDIEDAVGSLGADTLEELSTPHFSFLAPPHYQGGKSGTAFPILVRDGGSWRVRFRRDGLRAPTRTGISAVAALVQAIIESSHRMMLEAGMLAIVGNRSALHGRTAFSPSPDAQHGRHINRMYVGDPGLPPGAIL
jgi:L-asparagine oxygenase